MCLEDMAVGRHTQVKTTTVVNDAGTGRLAGNPRRVALLWAVPVDTNLIVSVPAVGSGGDAVVWNQTYVPLTLNALPGRLHISEVGQVVMGPLIFGGIAADLVVVEVLADDELDQKINDHWDRLWRTKGG